MTDDIRKIYGDARFVLRNDSLENWQTENPVLLAGEPSYVTDGEDNKKIKFGDGITPWNDLDYFSSGTDVEVDQTYTPESENAQSGKAVAEGIGKEIQGKISVWQKNTEYKVGDIVVANFVDSDLFDPEGNLNRMVIAKCVRQHTSDSFFDLTNLEIETAWEILQETYAYYDALGNRIHNTYATKDENKQNIKPLVTGNYYNEGDYVLAKGSVNGVTMSLICKCKNAHTSDGTVGSTNWTIVGRITAENAINDEKGNNIIGTYAPLAMISNFKLTKLAPNGVFPIKPNMLIMAMAGDGNNCINYYGNAGENIKVTDANMILIFSVASNSDIEGTNYNKNMVRVSCLYYENAFSFGTKNNYMYKPEIKNNSSDKSVYVYYIEQGGNN